jgi:hypothetical protein
MLDGLAIPNRHKDELEQYDVYRADGPAVNDRNLL